MSIAKALGMTDNEFMEMIEQDKCQLASCRYNRNGICQNEDKRKECVDVSMKVLCLEGNQNG